VSQERKFGGMHGFYDAKNELFFSYQSYSICVSIQKGKFTDSKTIDKVKKKAGIENEQVQAEYKEPEINGENMVVEATVVEPERPRAEVSAACYILPASDSEVIFIAFYTINQRDVVVEHEVVNEYLRTGLKEYIGDSQNAEVINFAGREIRLDNACYWRAPNNLFCKGGQINWSEFPSYDQAVVDLQLRVLANEYEDRKILSDEDIEVIFEDIPTIARRIVYNDPDSYYPLAVYYIVQDVRGRSVSCVLSNYVYNDKDYELSSLLRMFMSIPTLPDDAYSEFDNPMIEEEWSHGSWDNNTDVPSFEVRAGTWLPIGNLRNTYEVAPSVAIYFGFPANNNFALDFGFNLAVPIDSKYFNFYHKDGEYRVKAHPLVGLSFRGRYQYTMAKNIYFTPYIGVGMHTLGTNLKKKYKDDDDEEDYYSITTIDISGGVILRYKKFGVFAEYHYTPYSIANRVREDFGSSAVNVGLSFSFR
jgi:hypothetical protein